MKILSIGNSFSDDTMEYVYDIANSFGVKSVFLGNLYIGGCSLEMHANNAFSDSATYEYRTNSSGIWSNQIHYKMSDAIKSENWDIISLQQVSYLSGDKSSYSIYLEKMLDYIKQTLNSDSKKCKIIWNMTWAYQNSSTHSDFYRYNNNQVVMYNEIVSAVKENILTNSDIAFVSPTGTAIQNARTSIIGDTLTRDGFHLDYFIGRYIAGLTFISKITGISVDDILFKPKEVSEEQKMIAIESVINAINNPYSVTQSKYKA